MSKSENKFLNVDRSTCRITIKCGDLGAHHAFAYHKIEQSLEDILDTNKGLEDLHHRKDVSFTVECFHIKAKIKTQQTLIVIFESTILSHDQTGDENSSLKGQILECFKSVGISRHENNMQMQKVQCVLNFI